MPAFGPLDRRMMRDVKQLHDFLWDRSWTGDADALLAYLEAEARELDAWLGVGGKLSRHARALLAVTRNDKARGSPLYELLFDAYNLAAATEHVRKKDYKGAAEHAASVVESDSIGLCSALGGFSLVQEWEGGTIDFMTYLSRLADLLEARGIADAGQYKRLTVAAHTAGRAWDGAAPPELQGLAATNAITAAAWCALATRTIRAKATGEAPSVPIADFGGVLRKIIARL